MKMQWIEHKSKKVLFVDYCGVKDEDEMIALLKEHAEVEKGVPGVVVLHDFTDAFASVKYMNEAKRLGENAGPNKAAKRALLGVQGVKQILLDAYLAFTGDKTTRVFKKESEALDWLAE